MGIKKIAFNISVITLNVFIMISILQIYKLFLNMFLLLLKL